jgi:hypothetical protein
MPHSSSSSGANMILYKKLTCDNLEHINQEIYSYVQTLNLDHKLFWNPVDVLAFMKNTPLFQHWLLKNGLPIRRLAVTIGTHADCCVPHADTPPSRYKLSWPVINTERTWNQWFEPIEDPCATEVNPLGGITYTKLNQLQEIGRMQVDSPALIRVDIPHSVWFESTARYPRIGLQCQLFTEPAAL